VCNQTDFSGSGEISAGSWVCGNPAVDEAWAKIPNAVRLNTGNQQIETRKQEEMKK
jgi:hypothetical protein